VDKYSTYSGKSSSGYPYIHLVDPGTRHGLSETRGLEKTASREHLPEVLELIESLTPQPDRLYLVNSALGAGEYVGFNLRGDWFTEAGLDHTPPGWDDIPVWDIDARRRAANTTEYVPRWGQLAWGYPTFYNAHRFRHHVNKDPERAYGYILGAFWDPRMRRVILVSELLEGLCRKLGASHIYDRIKRNEFLTTDAVFAGTLPALQLSTVLTSRSLGSRPTVCERFSQMAACAGSTTTTRDSSTTPLCSLEPRDLRRSCRT